VLPLVKHLFTITIIKVHAFAQEKKNKKQKKNSGF
jgi:hypothetical protein